MTRRNGALNGWENCGIVIRCIWDGQETKGNLGFLVTFFHRVPKAFNRCAWVKK